MTTYGKKNSNQKAFCCGMKVLHQSKKSICATSRDIASKGEFISENREAYGNNLIVAWIYGSPAWTVAMIIAWFFGGALKAILNGPGSVEATVILLISGIAMFGDLFGLIIAIDALRHEDRVVATWHWFRNVFVATCTITFWMWIYASPLYFIGYIIAHFRGVPSAMGLISLIPFAISCLGFFIGFVMLACEASQYNRKNTNDINWLVHYLVTVIIVIIGRIALALKYKEC